jgi:hypothetical protein
MQSDRIRLEWRGGVDETFSSLDEAKQAVRAVCPQARSLPWHTTEDGNYRCLNFLEGATKKGEPVARILIPLTDDIST